AERFGGGRSTGHKALDLADPQAPLGVEKPSDFTWNQLLGFDACVQCGKCEAMCPAFAAGQADDHVLDQLLRVQRLAGGNDA
ncbi:(Fe-S)-binding protein, partial [Pseudomonas aeruginosa]